MIALTLAEIADLTGGHLSGGADPRTVISGAVVHDSRQVRPGGLFAAIKGGRVDGHDLAADAVTSGAAAVLAARPVEAPAVLVPDVITALGVLARHVLSRLPDLTVVALTGSVGKTSVKDLLGQVLARAGETIAPTGSFNNKLGLPLTVLRADERTRFLVLEMGARHHGDIAALTRIAPPSVGMVLNVRSAHIGEFGSQKAIAEAKSEIVRALPRAAEGGVAVLNADDPLVRAMERDTRARAIRFGTSHDAEVRYSAVTTEEGRASFTLHTPTGDAAVTLKVIGRHQVDNAVAAAAAAHSVGMTAAAIAEALSQAEPLSAGRMQVLRRERDDVLIVNDAFNASPDSAHAGLAAFAELAGTRRTVAVLGEMRELGDTAAKEHRQVGALVARLGIEVLVTVGGGDTDHIAAAAGDVDLHYATDPDDLVLVLKELLRPGDAVYLKAARSVGLENFADTLVRERT